MVERIDKPEPPPTYGVPAATESKRDKPREERRQEDLPTFRKREGFLYKEKFGTEGATRRPLKIPVTEIVALKFRRIFPRGGNPMVEADLVWKDGRVTEGVSFLLRQREDFLKLRNLKVGEPIPPPFWNTGPELEISIRQEGSTSGPWRLSDVMGETRVTEVKTPRGWGQRAGIFLGLLEPDTLMFRPAVGIFYGVALIAAALTILVILQGA